MKKRGRASPKARSSPLKLQHDARGTVDPLLEFHAGEIARSAGDTAGARRHLERALALDPRFHVLYAAEARRLLASMGPGARNAAPGVAARR